MRDIIEPALLHHSDAMFMRRRKNVETLRLEIIWNDFQILHFWFKYRFRKLSLGRNMKQVPTYSPLFAVTCTAIKVDMFISIQKIIQKKVESADPGCENPPLTSQRSVSKCVERCPPPPPPPQRRLQLSLAHCSHEASVCPGAHSQTGLWVGAPRCCTRKTHFSSSFVSRWRIRIQIQISVSDLD